MFEVKYVKLAWHPVVFFMHLVCKTFIKIMTFTLVLKICDCHFGFIRQGNWVTELRVKYYAVALLTLRNNFGSGLGLYKG